MADIIYDKAYAKVNIGLDVTGRRENGYHDVCMIMQQVGIYDELTFETTENSGIVIISEDEDIESKKGVPLGEDNLIYKAAKLLMDRGEVKEGLKITLKKNIPVAAGMAGGSTDAASTFRCVNKIFDLGYTEAELREMAVKLGADIPYCIMGGTALSEGIGEELTKLKSFPEICIVVVKPQVSVSTKEVYTAFDSRDINTYNHPDIYKMTEIINSDNSEKRVKEIANLMGNVLEEVTIPLHPEIDEIKKLLMKEGAINAMMSGSGPTVFAFYENTNEGISAAEAAKDRILKLEYVSDAFVTTVINN